MSTCPPPPKLPDAERGSRAAEIAEAMGVQSCDTSTKTFNASADYSALGGLAAKGSIDITYNESSSIGCEPLIISADTYYKNQQAINCTLKSSKATVSREFNAGNKIVLEAGRDIKTNCNEFVINQSVSINVVDLTQLSTSDVTSIAKATKDVISSITNNVLEQKMELGATPNGAKDVKDKLAQINETDYNALVNETINNISLSVNASNDIIIKAGRDLILSGERCKFSQDIVLEIVSTAIITDSVSRVFESVSEVINTNDEGRKQVYDAKGLSDFIAKARKRGTSWITWIIIIAVVLIGGGIAYKFFTSKKSGEEGGVEESGSSSSSVSSFRYY